MEKDQEAVRATSKVREAAHRAVPDPGKLFGQPPRTAEGKALDPRVEALDARWQEFEELDYEGQIALFLQTLDEDYLAVDGEDDWVDDEGKTALMDAETAFAMLGAIHEQGIERGNDGRFVSLLESLRERLPEVYGQDAHYYLEWRIAHALATGQGGAIPALLDDLAETADRDIDIFNKVIEQLAYQGQLSILVEAMRRAWPRVKESDNIVPWGVAEFAEQAGTYEIFGVLERGLPDDGVEAELPSRIETYHEIDPEALTRYLGHITGRTQRSWIPGDFEFLERRSEAGDPQAENLFHLGVEFLGYLRREEGVSYPKGELARQQIQAYLLERSGKSPDSARGGKAKRSPPQSIPAAGLCPDRDTLEPYLARLMGSLFPQRYKAAALMDLMPAWLRFLESRRLIDAEQRESARVGLRELADPLRRIWEVYRFDPALLEGLKNSGLLSSP